MNFKSSKVISGKPKKNVKSKKEPKTASNIQQKLQTLNIQTEPYKSKKRKISQVSQDR